jgi:hypothetical protein
LHDKWLTGLRFWDAATAQPTTSQQGEQPTMTTKTDFTPETWQSIVAMPATVGQLVITASFGPGDMLQEAKALSQQLHMLVQQPGDQPLLVALAADIKQKLDEEAERAKSNQPHHTETPAKQDPAVQKAQTLAGLRTAIAAVDATATPQEAAQLKQWLYGVGEAVANAAKEGDFFGIGGKKVSDAEAAVLGEIKAALGL